jgi:arginine decarboxylase-like protein
MEALDYLRGQGMGDCLNLLHFHLGSQINNIRNIKGAIIELTRVYTELQRLGAGLKYIDVGGGLGVDYDGSKTDFGSSVNYGLQEYANDVIFHVKEICDQAGVEHPTIISESGRAMVAFHSVLVFNIIGWSGFARFELPSEISKKDRKGMPAPVVNLFETYLGVNEQNFMEYYHDAQLSKDAVLNLFNLGYCTLEHRSLSQPSLARQRQQLLIGNAAPQEERQTGRKVQIADAIRRASGHGGGFSLSAVQELRIGQKTAHRHLDAAIEGSTLAPQPVERHQRADIASRRRTAVGTAGE